MDLTTILQEAIHRDASDVYLKPGSPPTLRISDELHALGDEPLSPEDTESLAAELMREREWTIFSETGQVNLAYSVAGFGRFRVNVYRQRSSTAMVLRQIRSNAPRFENLHLPPVLLEMVLLERGLLLVTGATGSGKSTTLAALIDHRNEQREGHVVTLEDPIEFLHHDKRCLVSQREIGTDVGTFHEALKDALRQTPDVILIGEMRDEETVTSALNFAETGHLVLSTLHSTNAYQTIERILQFFPEARHPQMLSQLANNLIGVVSQRLVPRSSGEGLVAVAEVLRATPRVRDLLRRNELVSLKKAMEDDVQVGMQTFDQALYELYKAGLITAETALLAADSVNDLKLRLRGFGAASVE